MVSKDKEADTKIIFKIAQASSDIIFDSIIMVAQNLFQTWCGDIVVDASRLPEKGILFYSFRILI